MEYLITYIKNLRSLLQGNGGTITKKQFYYIVINNYKAINFVLLLIMTYNAIILITGSMSIS